MQTTAACFILLGKKKMHRKTKKLTGKSKHGLHNQLLIFYWFSLFFYTCVWFLWM